METVLSVGRRVIVDRAVEGCALARPPAHPGLPRAPCLSTAVTSRAAGVLNVGRKSLVERHVSDVIAGKRSEEAIEAEKRGRPERQAQEGEPDRCGYEHRDHGAEPPAQLERRPSRRREGSLRARSLRVWSRPRCEVVVAYVIARTSGRPGFFLDIVNVFKERRMGRCSTLAVVKGIDHGYRYCQVVQL